MTPAGSALVHGHVGRDPARIDVTGQIFGPETTVHIQEWHQAAGPVPAGWSHARVELDEQGRRDLIMALGGTP
jgi:hypothetical protein